MVYADFRTGKGVFKGHFARVLLTLCQVHLELSNGFGEGTERAFPACVSVKTQKSKLAFRLHTSAISLLECDMICVMCRSDGLRTNQ